MTTGSSFRIRTGVANKTYNITLKDNATNTTKATVKTDADGILTFNVEDPYMNPAASAYTFLLNGKEVNLFAGDPALIYSAEITPVSFIDEPAVATIVTLPQATKVQFVENGKTWTYTKDSSKVTVEENTDGTLTWTINVTGLALGEHTLAVRGRTSSAWEDSTFTLTTKKIPAEKPVITALISAENAEITVGETPTMYVRVLEGTEKVQFVYNGKTSTYARSDKYIDAVVDGVETWKITTMSGLKVGVTDVQVIARYDGAWQKDTAKTVTVTVNRKPAAEAAEIFSASVPAEAARGESVTLTVLTNQAAKKVQYVYPSGSTTTYTASNAEVTDNGDGTLIWTITRTFTKAGETEIKLSARNAAGVWTEPEVYDTIFITP
jgi:hypothetical protein